MRPINISPLLISLILFLSFLSCEEQTEWTFQPGENGQLVIDAIITDELKTQEVWLSLSGNDQNGIPVPVSNARVLLTAEGLSLAFEADPQLPGRYCSEQTFSAQLHTNYTLEIDWEGETYEASNEMVPVLPLQPITFQAAGGGDSLSIAEVAPLYSPDEQAFYEIDIDWSGQPGEGPKAAKLFYYTFSTVDISELFRPPQETVIFPRGSLVIERKYSLNPDFAAYQRSLLLETNWQGGLFDESSSSLPSNVSNGGLGFFGVCAVLADTLVAN